MNLQFDNLLHQILVITNFLKVPLFTFFGSTCLYILNRLNGKQPFSLFSAININIGKNARPTVIIWDIIFSSIIGTVIIIPLVTPTTVAQGVAAGLGLTGVLSTYAKDVEEK
jgi:hypothetical protein